GHETGLPERIAHEILTVDPFPLRMPGGISQYGVTHLVGRRIHDADVEIVGIAGRKRKVGMRMHVVEARHREAPTKIHHGGLRTYKMLYIRALAPRDNASARNGQRLTPGHAQIAGVD